MATTTLTCPTGPWYQEAVTCLAVFAGIGFLVLSVAFAAWIAAKADLL